MFVLINSFLMFGNSIVRILKPGLLIQQENVVHFITISSFTCILLIGIAGFGLYESNAIQFGMDKMLEVSSEELSSFIHWYYWSVHLWQLIIIILYSYYCDSILAKLQGSSRQNYRTRVWFRFRLDVYFCNFYWSCTDHHWTFYCYNVKESSVHWFHMYKST